MEQKQEPYVALLKKQSIFLNKSIITKDSCHGCVRTEFLKFKEVNEQNVKEFCGYINTLHEEGKLRWLCDQLISIKMSNDSYLFVAYYQ